MKRTLLVLSILLSLAAMYAAGQQDTIIIDIKGGGKPLRLALPEFDSDRSDPKVAALADTFNRVLWDDLEYAGPIELASRSFYPSGRLQTAGDLKSEDWLRPGLEATYIAFGNLRIRENELTVAAQLHHVATRARAFGNQYTARNVDEATVRDMAHRLADEILANLGIGTADRIGRTEIVYVCDRAANGISELCVMGYDGFGSKPLTAIGDLALTPAWSPDSKKIAFTSYRDGSGIEVIGRTDLRRHAFQRPAGLSTMPSWSPDGKRIAYAARSSDSRSGLHIMVADEDGRNVRQLTASDRTDYSPVWNPRTGNEIAFISDRSPSREGAPLLYIMDAEGTNVRQKGKDGGAANNPSWSPDGKYIAFAWQESGSGKKRNIWLLNLESGKMANLTQDQGDNERPSWAPDSLHLAFASNRSGSWQVYTMLADGTKPRSLTRGGRNQGPAWSGYPR